MTNEQLMTAHDADTAKRIEDERILEHIASVGKVHGLQSNWLNDQASTVDLPEGAQARAKSIGRWKSIGAILMDRVDLIRMKAAAFSTRRDETLKDIEDLALMGPTAAEVKGAIDFLRKTRSPPKGATKNMIEEFNETIADLKKLIPRR